MIARVTLPSLALLGLLGCTGGSSTPTPRQSAPQDFSQVAGFSDAGAGPILREILLPGVSELLDESLLSELSGFNTEISSTLLQDARDYDIAAGALLLALEFETTADGTPVSNSTVQDLLQAGTKLGTDYFDGFLRVLELLGPAGREAVLSTNQFASPADLLGPIDQFISPHLLRLSISAGPVNMQQDTETALLLLSDAQRQRRISIAMADLYALAFKLSPSDPEFVESLGKGLDDLGKSLANSAGQRLDDAIKLFRLVPEQSRATMLTSPAFTDYAGLTFDSSTCSMMLLAGPGGGASLDAGGGSGPDAGAGGGPGMSAGAAGMGGAGMGAAGMGGPGMGGAGMGGAGMGAAGMGGPGMGGPGMGAEAGPGMGAGASPGMGGMGAGMGSPGMGMGAGQGPGPGPGADESEPYPAQGNTPPEPTHQ